MEKEKDSPAKPSARPKTAPQAFNKDAYISWVYSVRKDMHKHTSTVGAEIGLLEEWLKKRVRLDLGGKGRVEVWELRGLYE